MLTESEMCDAGGAVTSDALLAGLSKRRVIGVTLCATAIQRFRIQWCQWCACLQPFDQIRVRDERPTEREQIGFTSRKLSGRQRKVITIVADPGVFKASA